MDQQPIGPPSPQSPHRSKRVRLVLGTIVAIGVVAVGVFAYRGVSGALALRHAESDLQAALAEVDAAEPDGWQWSDLEAQREKIADDANSSLIIVQAARSMPGDWKNEPIFDEVKGLPPPAQLTREQTAALRAVLETLEPALTQGRKLVDLPKGRFPPIALSKDYFNTPISHRDQVRDVGAMLFSEALYQCQDRAYARAWAAAVATLNAGRSLGDEPLMGSQATRIILQGLAVEAMERILAHGTLDADMLQQSARLRRNEIDCDLARVAIRGERAGQHHFYTNLGSGALDLRDMARWQEVNWWDRADEATRKTILTGSHAYELRMLTRALADLKKPATERQEACTQWRLMHQDLLARERVPKLAEVLTPAVWRLAELELRHEAVMECAIAAFAAEEFRLREKRWPKDLEELVAAKLLPGIPLDVYDGHPLRLRHAPDGVVIYSVGPLKGKLYEGDAWDDLGTPPPNDQARVEALRRDRTEFRLWNLERRRQAPVPPRVEDEP
jgi:hypothetical protein